MWLQVPGGNKITDSESKQYRLEACTEHVRRVFQTRNFQPPQILLRGVWSVPHLKEKLYSIDILAFVFRIRLFSRAPSMRDFETSQARRVTVSCSGCRLL